MAKKQYDETVWDLSSSESQGGSHKVGYSCYHSHPALKFTAKDGQEYKIYGGNCSTPIVYDADIYVGLAYGACNPSRVYPWDKDYKPVTVIDYPITDMCAPKDAGSFMLMIDWLCNQLQAGKKIHVGCIGGHGRTGIVLSAVYAQMTGEKDAIQYVRQHYCKKAVESHTQVKFLMEHFGVSEAEENKKTPMYPATTNWNGYGKSNGYQGSSGSSKSSVAKFQGSKRQISSVLSPKCIW